jgi:hypothetical protein
VAFIQYTLSKYTLYECFGYILSPVFYRFFNILHNFAHCNISLAKKMSHMLNNFYYITKCLQKSIFKNIRF